VATQLHAFSQQREIVEYCQKNGIVVEAYCPLVRNMKSKDPTLNQIGRQYGKKAGHVLIRYCLQKGWVPLPKSDTPERIVENANVYDFELTREDMERLDGLDEGENGAIVETVVNTV
jgi:diketogulonate reductase-like aldo/keto reductase